MRVVGTLMIGFVAVQHFAFLVLEMFLWAEPIGIQVFGLDREFAKESATLAANQGLYNGFLAAGLVWSLVRRADARANKIFFLSCIVVAGVFGAATAGASILFVQALPAAIALALTLFDKPEENPPRDAHAA